MKLRPFLLALQALLAAPAMAAAPAKHPTAAPAAGAVDFPNRPPAGTAVVLAARPGTALDRTARTLAAEDLAEARRSRDRPLVLTGSAVLGAPPPVLFVQLQSPRECGSAGCSTSAYQHTGRSWRKILDSVSGTVVVDRQTHNGMPDLLIDKARYAWNGTTYADTNPAPAINLIRPPRR